MGDNDNDVTGAVSNARVTHCRCAVNFDHSLAEEGDISDLISDTVASMITHADPEAWAAFWQTVIDEAANDG